MKRFVGGRFAASFLFLAVTILATAAAIEDTPRTHVARSAPRLPLVATMTDAGARSSGSDALNR